MVHWYWLPIVGFLALCAGIALCALMRDPALQSREQEIARLQAALDLSKQRTAWAEQQLKLQLAAVRVMDGQAAGSKVEKAAKKALEAMKAEEANELLRDIVEITATRGGKVHVVRRPGPKEAK